MIKLNIYLAGKVPKSDLSNFKDWREECKKILGEEKYNYINPTENRVREDDLFGVYGQCVSHIKTSDIIVDSYSDLEDAILKINNMQIKDISIIDKSFLYYKNTYLNKKIG